MILFLTTGVGIILSPSSNGNRNHYYMGYASLGLAAITALLMCYSWSETALVFDDGKQLIWTEHKRCCGALRSRSSLGPYDTFKRAQLREWTEDDGQTRYEIRFLFNDGAKRYKDTSTGKSNKDEMRKLVDDINTWWSDKRVVLNRESVDLVVHEHGNDHTVHTVISCTPSSSPSQSDGADNESNDVVITANHTATSTMCTDTPTERVSSWMEGTVRLPEYTELLLENGFESLSIFQNLSIDDLHFMGITQSEHCDRILSEAQKLEPESSESSCDLLTEGRWRMMY